MNSYQFVDLSQYQASDSHERPMPTRDELSHETDIALERIAAQLAASSRHVKHLPAITTKVHYAND